jgi:hypothetical protein
MWALISSTLLLVLFSVDKRFTASVKGYKIRDVVKQEDGCDVHSKHSPPSSAGDKEKKAFQGKQ